MILQRQRSAIEGRWEYRSNSRDISLRYTFDADRDGRCELTTEIDGRYAYNSTIRNDYGVIITRAQETKRIVHEGTWREKSRNEFATTFNAYRADRNGNDRMTDNLKIEGNRLIILDWRQGLYGKRPDFRFTRVGDSGGGFPGDGGGNGSSDFEGTYRSELFFDRDRRNGLRYRLELTRGRARLEVERNGRVPLDRNSLDDFGRILERLERRSRITFTGDFRVTRDELSIEFKQLDNGEREEKINSKMVGNRRGRSLEMSRYDETLFGRRARLRFD